MLRILLAAAVALVAIPWIGQAADNDAPPAQAKPPLKLPPNWNLLGLADDQKDKLADIQADYAPKFSALHSEYDKLHHQYLEPFSAKGIPKGDLAAYQLAVADWQKQRDDLLSQGQVKEKEKDELHQKMQDEMDQVLTDKQQTKIQILYVNAHLPTLWRSLKLTDDQKAAIYSSLHENGPKIAALDQQINDAEQEKILDFQRRSLAASSAAAESHGIGQKHPGLEHHWVSSVSADQAQESLPKLYKAKQQLEQQLLSDLGAVLTIEQQTKLEKLTAANQR